MHTLKQIFASVLGIPIESVVPTMAPENTPSWDSLNAIILVTEIEKSFALKFSFDEAMGVKNFGDAVTLLTAKGADLHD